MNVRCMPVSTGPSFIWRLCIALALLSGTISSALATNYCVSTPTQLTDALTLSQYSPGTNSIRLRPGTYTMPSAVNFSNAFGGDLYLSGDWNAGCTVRGENPYATVIDGQGTATSAWSLRSASIDITIQLLRFNNMRFVEFNDVGLSGCEPNGQKFIVRRSIFQGSSGLDKLNFFSDCHGITVDNSLVQGGNNGIQISNSLDADQAPTVRLVHNTVTGASNYGVRIGGFADEFAAVSLYNNIIYGHGLEDVKIRTDRTINAIGNNWGEIDISGGGGLSLTSTNNVTTNPQLLSSGRPIEPSSSVINTASISIPGGLPATDIEGNQRIIGSAPDRGAFETDVSNATVLTVTDPNDSGPGTLRQAIITANASPNAQIITFNIPGSCPQSIFLQSPLPSITDDGLLLINGETQPGSSANTLDDGNNAVICIQLRKSSQVGTVSRAIRVPTTSDAFLILKGIGFGGFVNAIELAGGNGHLIQGNRFGDPLPANSVGVLVEVGSSDVKIGGTSSPALRNTIANSSFSGLFVSGSDAEISNNYIGTDTNGLAARPNNVGVFLFGAARAQVFANVISGNTLSGLFLSGAEATENSITNNHIGVTRDSSLGDFPLGNGTAGVLISGGAHDNRIGGDLRNSGNIIAFNDEDGVAVLSGQRNRIEGNRIYGNGGLGIDLAASGVTLNDDDSNSIPLDYANRGLNFPVLTSAVGGDASGTVSGSLSSTADFYRIELFKNPSCDASGHGEGSIKIGVAHVTLPRLPGQHTRTFSAMVQAAPGTLTGDITATATDTDGNTSEFSACIPYDSSDVIFADGFESQ